MKRSLNVSIQTSDHSVVDRGSIEIINLQQGLHGQIIGRLTNLTAEDGGIAGMLEFNGPYAKACEELFCTNEHEPRLSIGVLGVCLTY